GSGVDGNVSALCVYDDGSGPALYAGGLFTRAGGQRIDSIARWDGQAWSSVGDGITNADFTPANIAALAAYDGALYAGGAFDTADGAPADYIARWICNPVGACCMPSGECEMVTEQRCATS